MTSPPPAKRFKQATIWEGFKRQLSKIKVDTKVKEAEKDFGETSASLTESTEPTQIDLTDSWKEDEKMSGLTEEEKQKCEQNRRKRANAAEKRSRDLQQLSCGAERLVPSKPMPLPIVNNSEGATASSSNSPPGARATVTTPSSSQEFNNSDPLFDSPESASPVSTTAWNEELTQGDDTELGVTLGVQKDLLNQSPGCRLPLRALKANNKHQVLVQLPLRTGEQPKPFPNTIHDQWDNDHVRMPYSEENLYPVNGKGGKKELKNRWELMQVALIDDLASSYDIKEAIMTYNTRYEQKWDFSGLHSFFSECLDREQTVDFFKNILPKMVDLALHLPFICTQPLRLLKQQEMQSVTFSQQQAACLLANAFFCTYPRRNAHGRHAEYATYPDINFNRLFTGTRGGISHRKAEKLTCIINYFRRVTTEMPCGMITMKRQNVPECPAWTTSRTKLTPLHVTSQGTIEAGGVGMLQVDFANKFLGGGVLGQGCVQEEIRFLLCPEMILSRLITQALDFNECLLMIGCEQFNDYTGYSDTFRWAGNHVDRTQRDEWGRRCTEVVAIDALIIQKHAEQFKQWCLRRELHKAYCGFYDPDCPKANLPAVATGNWGCGAFGGDHQLKALIQMMAAAEAGRSVAYYTFGDTCLAHDIHNVHIFITEHQLTIADLCKLITRYHGTLLGQGQGQAGRGRKTLFEFILAAHPVGTAGDWDGDVAMADGDSVTARQCATAQPPPSPDWGSSTP